MNQIRTSANLASLGLRRQADIIISKIWRQSLRLLPFIHNSRTENLSSAHILVIAPLFLGDLAMCAPFLVSLRKAYPNKKLTLICRNGLDDVCTLFPLDHVISETKYSITTRKKLDLINTKGWEKIFCVFSDAWLPFVHSLTHKEIISFSTYKNRHKKFITQNIFYPNEVMNRENLTQQLLPKSKRLQSSCIPIDIWTPKNAHLVIHLGARSSARRLSVNSLSILLKAIRQSQLKNRKIFFTVNNGEGPPLPCSLDNYEDLRGRTSLSKLIEIMATSDAVIGVDTGVTHLSKMIGTPTLVFLGQSQSILYGEDDHFSRSVHISIEDLNCRTKKTIHKVELDWVNTCSAKECPINANTPPCLDIFHLNKLKGPIDRIFNYINDHFSNQKSR